MPLSITTLFSIFEKLLIECHNEDMKFGTTGAVIGGASKDSGTPMMMLGSIPVLKRIVLTLEKAGVFPIVVTAETEEEKLTRELSSLGVIFMQRDKENRHCDLFESVKLGLEFLQNKCDRVFFTPINNPMVVPNTLYRLMEKKSDVVLPSYNSRAGHPVLISNEVIPRILAYKGDNGLKGALENTTLHKEYVDVDDSGVRMSIHNEEELKAHLSVHNTALLSPTLNISIDKEDVIINSRLVLLLFLIGDFRSIRQASLHMALSYQKAWNMINTLEKEVGYEVVERKRGGTNGGETNLTDKGRSLILAFQKYKEELHSISLSLFEKVFKESRVI